MTAPEMQRAFVTLHPEAAGAAFDAWAYGADPDELARLTLAGRKRATASALPLYEAEGETVPHAGEYSIILDSRGDAVCIVRTTQVSIIPFCRVSAAFAAREGEGDLSLAWWRQVHESYFTRVMSEAGLTFTHDMPVVCEEFEVVYP
ncbi:MAG: ASCH domain-containing protein [Clostridia bacterium]|nr:ASCH domain-containing protein [Clostridia bacterium]